MSKNIARKPKNIYWPNVKNILTSKEFYPFSMASNYEKLQTASRVDFSSTIKLLNILPVFLDGNEHKDIRKSMAIRISETKNEQENAVRIKVRKLMEDYCKKNCEFDLLNDYSVKIWHEISRSIVNCDANTAKIIDQIPLLFSESLSIMKRKKIDSDISSFIEHYGEEKLIDIALATLGSRPFVGSLSLSIFEVIKNNINKKICDYDFGKTYSKSSLTFVDRVCRRNMAIDCEEYKENDVLRCYIQSDNYNKKANEEMLFGVKDRVCLGKTIAEFTYELIAEESRNYNCKFLALSIDIDKNIAPFSMPENVIVRVDVE